jgi:hypothetical protein
MGWYSFPNLPGERQYTVFVSAKRFRFTKQVPAGAYLIRDVDDVNFQADPPGF